MTINVQEKKLNEKVINIQELLQNLRFCKYSMTNIKAIYFFGEVEDKQRLNIILDELVAKKFGLNGDYAKLNEMITQKANHYFLKDDCTTGTEAYWKAHTELLDVNTVNASTTLMYVLNSSHPLRKIFDDKEIIDNYPLSIINQQTSDTMLILTEDTPNKMLQRLID